MFTNSGGVSVDHQSLVACPDQPRGCRGSQSSKLKMAEHRLTGRSVGVGQSSRLCAEHKQVALGPYPFHTRVCPVIPGAVVPCVE